MLSETGTTESIKVSTILHLIVEKPQIRCSYNIHNADGRVLTKYSIDVNNNIF